MASLSTPWIMAVARSSQGQGSTVLLRPISVPSTVTLDCACGAVKRPVRAWRGVCGAVRRLTAVRVVVQCRVTDVPGAFCSMSPGRSDRQIAARGGREPTPPRQTVGTRPCVRSAACDASVVQSGYLSVVSSHGVPVHLPGMVHDWAARREDISVVQHWKALEEIWWMRFPKSCLNSLKIALLNWHSALVAGATGWPAPGGCERRPVSVIGGYGSAAGVGRITENRKKPRMNEIGRSWTGEGCEHTADDNRGQRGLSSYGLDQGGV